MQPHPVELQGLGNRLFQMRGTQVCWIGQKSLLPRLQRNQSQCIPKPQRSSRRDHPGVPNDSSLSLGWDHQEAAILHETEQDIVTLFPLKKLYARVRLDAGGYPRPVAFLPHFAPIKSSNEPGFAV